MLCIGNCGRSVQVADDNKGIGRRIKQSPGKRTRGQQETNIKPRSMQVADDNKGIIRSVQVADDNKGIARRTKLSPGKRTPRPAGKNQTKVRAGGR
eukprot:1156780-Pelagomonas_calceolata.AAC.7